MLISWKRKLNRWRMKDHRFKWRRWSTDYHLNLLQLHLKLHLKKERSGLDERLKQMKLKQMKTNQTVCNFVFLYPCLKKVERKIWFNWIFEKVMECLSSEFLQLLKMRWKERKIWVGWKLKQMVILLFFFIPVSIWVERNIYVRWIFGKGDIILFCFSFISKCAEGSSGLDSFLKCVEKKICVKWISENGDRLLFIPFCYILKRAESKTCIRWMVERHGRWFIIWFFFILISNCVQRKIWFGWMFEKGNRLFINLLISFQNTLKEWSGMDACLKQWPGGP